MGYYNNHMPNTKHAAASYLCPSSLPPVVRQEWIAAVVENADEESLVEKAKMNYVANNVQVFLDYIIRLLSNHGVECNVEKVDVGAFHELLKFKDPDNPNNDYQPDNGDNVMHLVMKFPTDTCSSRLFYSIIYKFSGVNVPGLPKAMYYDDKKRLIRMQVLPSITLDNLSLLFRLACFHYTIRPYKNPQGS